tara:strand:+ start:10440 stop:11381 length:942 start_codon:yes stop_codon:yes gene_type:complete
MTNESSIINIFDLRQKSILMLKDISEILNKYNIVYWLDFGSLLGAVRNSKAIPWDGDFDLSTLESEKIVNNENLLADLIDKGYQVDITYSNIKIVKANWTFGRYTTDIHRYRINDKNEAEYEYGIKYKNKLISKLFQISNSIYSSIKIDKNFKRKYPTYGAICRSLILAGNNPDNLENKNNFNISLTNSNDIYDFKISSKEFEFKMDSEKRAGIKSRKRLETILSITPNLIKIISYKFIAKVILPIFKIYPQKRVFFPKYFFDELEVVEFNGLSFFSPSPKQKYLERIYGVNWFKPTVTKNKSYLDKISYEKK